MFIEKLQEQMINVDWSKMFRRYNIEYIDDLCYDYNKEIYHGNQTLKKMMKISSHSTMVDEVLRVVNFKKMQSGSNAKFINYWL